MSVFIIMENKGKGEAKYICGQCQKIFQTRGGFGKHARNAHKVALARARSHSPMADVGKKGVQENICPYCKKLFSTNSNLKRHLDAEACIRCKESHGISPMREDEKETGEQTLHCHKTYKIPARRTYTVNVHWDPKELLRIIDDNTELRMEESNFFLPVFKISSPMYRWERVGSSSYKFGTQDGLTSAEDALTYKSVCTVLDGFHEIKIYSQDFAFMPPELKENCYCVMLFFGVRRTRTARSSYLWINQDSGWAIQSPGGDALFAAGNVNQVSSGWDFDPSFYFVSGLRVATKKDFVVHSEGTKSPWLSFAIDRVRSIPNQLLQLNTEQREVAHRIRKAIDKVNKPYHDVIRNAVNIHFINGLPGTGKSFLLEALYYYCRSQGVNCKVVAFTKMVANMYPEGATIHSYFHIPFKKGRVEEPGTEALPSKSQLYSILNLRVLFIDEICCVRKNLLVIIDSCLRKLHNPYVPFGGLLVIAAGDFNQLPPVSNNDETSECKDKAEITASFSSMECFSEGPKIYLLETPCRVHISGPDTRLVKLMSEAMTKNLIEFDPQLVLGSVKEGIAFAYGDSKFWPGAFTQGSAIICFTNAAALEVNASVFSIWKGHSTEESKVSIKTAAYCFSKSKSKTLRMRALNKVQPKLLAEGMPLFCNKNTKEGLVNGAQVIYKGSAKGSRGGVHLLVTELNSGQEGRSYLIGPDGVGYPFDWGFALTVHKAQGRTFNRVCVVFVGDEEPFVHGQLTVALTRVRSLDDLRIVKASRQCMNPIDGSIQKIAEGLKKRALNKKH